MSDHVIRLDPIACEGHGVCAELFPEMIVLDDWGYPMLDGRPIPAHLVGHARRAATNCPALALRLEKATATAPPARRSDQPVVPTADPPPPPAG